MIYKINNKPETKRANKQQILLNYVGLRLSKDFLRLNTWSPSLARYNAFSTVPIFRSPSNTENDMIQNRSNNNTRQNDHTEMENTTQNNVEQNNLVQNNSNENIKFLRDAYEPDNAGTEERQIAKKLVNKFELLKKNGSATVDDVKQGSDNLDKEINDVTKHNVRVIRGGPGQRIEVHGDNETQSVSARFENKDGSLSYEVVSTKTPDNVDREDFYEDQPTLWGRSEQEGDISKAGPSRYVARYESSGEEVSSESVNPNRPEPSESVEAAPIISPLVTVETTYHDRIVTEYGDGLDDGSLDTKGKRKAEESPERPVKQAKKDDDDDDEGKGSGLGGLQSGYNSNSNSNNDNNSQSKNENLRDYLRFSLISFVDFITSIIDTFFNFF